MRSIVGLLLTYLLLGSCVAAQSGVLLGLETSSTTQGGDTEEFKTIHPPEYQTLWIGPAADGKLSVLASIPQLVVPRRDGFWHVGVKQVCEMGPSAALAGDFPNESLLQVVWAAPVTAAATVQQSTPCKPHKPEDYAPPFMRSEEDKNKISQCGFELVNLRFVSPEILSASDYSSQSGGCEPRGGRDSSSSSVRNFDSDQPLSFSQLLGPAAGKAYQAALPKQARDQMDQECGEPDRTSDTAWEVSHQHGRWYAAVDQNLGNSDCSVRAPINFALPASVAGDRVPSFDWKLMKSKVEGLKDVFVSPASDILIAVTASELRFYELTGGLPGRLLLTLPAKPVVMAQWAKGAHVADWTAQMGKLALQQLPEPVANVKPNSN